MKRWPLAVAICLAAWCGGRCEAAEADLLAPRMQQLKEAYTAGKGKLDAERVASLKTLVADYRGKMDRWLEERKVAANVSGMAAARTGINTFARFAEELDEKQDFEIPDKPRRELQEPLAECRAAKAVIDDAHRVAVEALSVRYLADFQKALVEQGADTPGAERLAELWRNLLGTASPAKSAPAADGQPPAGGGAAPADAPPGVIAQTGASDNWVTFANWQAEVHGMEMIEIPVMDREEPEDGEGFNPIVAEEYRTRYVPLRLLTPGVGFQFRVKSVKGALPADVVEWPAAANGWRFTVRVRPGAEAPSRHALELQVGFVDADKLPVLGAASNDDPNAPQVRISVRTQPPGAFVYVDGRVYRVGRQSQPTPCEVPMSKGTHSILIRKYGYRDVRDDHFEAVEGKSLNVVLRQDTSISDVTVSVNAFKGWERTGVDVEAGDMILITATGTWSAGKNDPIGPEGYPNDDKYYKYYLNPRDNPRITANANYGALIMRIGRDGAPVPVNAELRTRAYQAGTIFLGVNEADTGSSLRDNGGTLKVRIQKAPARMAQ